MIVNDLLEKEKNMSRYRLSKRKRSCNDNYY